MRSTLLFMTAIALFERSFGIVVLFFVTILAVFMKSILQLQCFLVRWIGRMAFTTFLDSVTFFPDVFTILVKMMTIVTGGAVFLGMLLMAEVYRPLLVCGIFMLKDDLVRDIGGGESPDRAEHKTAKDNRQKA